jgi:hypothetical protein
MCKFSLCFNNRSTLLTFHNSAFDFPKRYSILGTMKSSHLTTSEISASPSSPQARVCQTSVYDFRMIFFSEPPGRLILGLPYALFWSVHLKRILSAPREAICELTPILEIRIQSMTFVTLKIRSCGRRRSKVSPYTDARVAASSKPAHCDIHPISKHLHSEVLRLLILNLA